MSMSTISVFPSRLSRYTPHDDHGEYTLCRLFQTCRRIGVYLSSEEHLHRSLTRQGLGWGWFFWWVTFKSLKTWMSHFQVSRDLDESLSSLSRLGWVTFKSLETWMMERPSITRAEHTGKWPTLLYISLYWSYSQLACSTILEFSSPPILGISILSVFPRHGGLQPPFRWVTFKSLKTWMSHFQVSQDLDKSQVSQDLDETKSQFTFKSLKTWMRSGKKRNRKPKFQCGLLLLKPTWTWSVESQDACMLL